MIIDGQVVRLWDDVAPGSESWTHEEQSAPSLGDVPVSIVRNVVQPRIQAFLPDVPTDRAVVVCPGGAFHFVSHVSEGLEVAQLLCGAGFAAFVLTYRVVRTPADEAEFATSLMAAFGAGGVDVDSMAGDVLPLATLDADRALELVRADGYKNVSMVGFSAGARLVAELMMRPSGQRRPDAGACVYLPSTRNAIANEGSPPLFLLAAADDPLGISGSLDLHEAWRMAGRSVELHLFEQGGHGFGTTRTGHSIDGWPTLLLGWLADR